MMILPLLALQGARKGSRSARRHFHGFARGPQSRAGPVSSVGIGRPSLPGLIGAMFSAKERLVQRIFTAPGALPCLNFRAWCSCWHPHGACTADRSSYAACAASRLQGHPRRHFYSVLHTASFGRMAAQAGWEAGAVLFISCVFSH